MSLRFIIFIAILALNAYFSAAEVALVVARRSKLEELARAGHLGARAALEVLSNPERLLSVTQVGVTLASLALGWAGEETVAQLEGGGYNSTLRAGTITVGTPLAPGTRTGGPGIRADEDMIFRFWHG